MKVTLLGTSSAEGWPALFCGCEACGAARRLGGKNIRTRCSAIVDDRLKIDLPPDILTQVVQNGLDLRCLTAILFTHAHADHCAPNELQYRGHYFVPKPFTDRLNLYGSRDVISTIMQCLSPDGSLMDQARYPLRLHTMTAYAALTISDYHVTPISANHDPAQECFNFIIEDEFGTTLLYATDTGWYSPETWEHLAQYKFDGVVIEATKGMQEDGYEGHLSIPQVIEFRNRLIDSGIFRPNGVMVTTHVSHLCGLMHEEMEALLAPHNILAGYDGMVFQVDSADAE
jgi:phosphoribosyl 1,2-cyclic phosphate phosphodiesterase